MRYFSCVLFLLFLSNTPGAWADSSSLSVGERQQALEAAEAVRMAILHADIDALSRLISREEGLVCTDDRYAYAKVKKDLHNKKSILYLSVFDGVKFRKQCGADYPVEYPAKSDQEFFRRVPNPVVKIVSAAKNYVDVEFQSDVAGLYPLQYTFHKEGGVWKLVAGLVIGNCTCG